MRKIDSIIVHCSATKAGQDFTAADIDRWHRDRGFAGIGYHYVIRLDGKIEKGRDVALPGAHCPGWNGRSIGICYIGGLDTNGKPADTCTPAQRRVLYEFIQELQREYPSINLVIGHRDTSPDRNGNGIIEPCEFVKACPCFDVAAFLRSTRLLLFMLLFAFVLPFLLSSCKSGRSLGWQRTESDSISVLMHRSGLESHFQATETASGQLEERIEQTIFVFGMDTVKRDFGKRYPPLSSVTHTVIDRKHRADSRATTVLDAVITDSVQAVHQVSSKNEVTVAPRKQRASRWWLMVVVVLVVGGVVGVRRK